MVEAHSTQDEKGAVKLRIADDLSLSGDFVTSTAGIFATKGQGKSHLGQVIAEEMLACGQVIVAIDPTDVWWGLLSSADGRRDGYPILVIGGDHGQLKLDPEPGAGTRLAEAIVAERFSCVICTDGLDDTVAIRFVREVLQTLFNKNRKPLHVFVDEADIFAPQQPKEQEDYRCIRALSHVVRRGRKKGIGSTLITQRPSELNASVRSQVETLFVLGLIHNLDIDAVEKWMRLRKKKRGNNAAFAKQEEMIDSLDTLQRGDAWVWAPRLKLHKRFRARAKDTFDSGATPSPGQKARVAKRLAPVDIARLGDAIAAAAERQKANDPIELKRQVLGLRRDLEGAHKHATDLEARLAVAIAGNDKIAARKVSVVRGADLRRLEAVAKSVDKAVLRLGGTGEDLTKRLSALTGLVERLGAASVTIHEVSSIAAESTGGSEKKPSRRSEGKPAVQALISGWQALSNPSAPQPPPPGKDHDLQPAHLRLLSAIAWWESVGVPAPDLGGVAFIAGTSTKSSAFDNNRSRLRSRGYIDYPSSGHVRLTEAGRRVTPPPVLPPTNVALHEAIFSKIAPALQRLLRALIDVYPGELSLAEFAKRAGTSTSSSAFDNNRSWLRARGLAEYPRSGFVRATSLLFPEGA